MPTQEARDRREYARLCNTDEARDLIRSTVKETLLSLGLDSGDPIKLQKDFQMLREWRETTESLKAHGLMTLIGIVVAGTLSALYIGLKTFLNAH